MTEIGGKMLGFVVRVGLTLAGLIFFVSLLAAGLLVLLVWLLRALWAKITGQPVSPWTFQVNRQAMWNHFRSPRPDGPERSSPPGAGEVIDADVTDVQVKRIDNSGH